MSTVDNSPPSLSPALIRTLVPILVGPLAARYFPGLDIEDPTFLLLASAVISYSYYVIVRVIEEHYPQFGWLLGLAKRPVYSSAPPVSPDAGETLATVVLPDVDVDDDDFADMDLGVEEDPLAADLGVEGVLTEEEQEIRVEEDEVPVVERHDPATHSASKKLSPPPS